VRRRCIVCEWEGEQVERAGLEPDCPWCHAPTEALEVLPLPGGVSLPDMPRGKNPFATALGRLGAKKGGHARARALSARRRSEIAREAARARWSAKGSGAPGRGRGAAGEKPLEKKRRDTPKRTTRKGGKGRKRGRR
jgi:hypothetical protein